MRVGVFAGTYLHLPQHGGVYTFVNEVLWALRESVQKSRHTFVLCSHDNTLPEEIISTPQIEFLSMNDYVTEPVLAKVYNRLTSKIRQYAPLLPDSELAAQKTREKNILRMLTDNAIECVWSPTSECLSQDVPYITTIFDLQHRIQPYFPEVSEQGEWKHREQHYRKLLQRATTIVTGTETGKAEIERFYQIPPERIKVNPFPTPHFAEHVSEEQNVSVIEKYHLPQKYLLYPAQFWPHKNHINLLRALHRLRDRFHITLPLVLVGADKGNKGHILQELSRLELSHQVHFLGFMAQEELVALYRSALALAFVSFFGPDNLPPLEAFALGCPVIASDVPGHREQLGDAALFVNPAQPETIALAIKSLVENETLRLNLIQRGSMRAATWTGGNYVETIFSILDEFQTVRNCWSIHPL